MTESKRILLEITEVDLPERTETDYFPKPLESYLVNGEQTLVKARRSELKKKNPRLSDEALNAIIAWETEHHIFTRFNYERPSYGVDEAGNAYGIFFHGKHEGVREFPQGRSDIPADFDIVSHVNNSAGDSRAYCLTFSPAVALQWFGSKLEVFLVPIAELDKLHDLYSIAQAQGIGNKKTLGRLQGEKEFVMFGDPLRAWYAGTIKAQMENLAGIKQVDAQSVGLLRSPAGVVLGDPNTFIEFVKRNTQPSKSSE